MRSIYRIKKLALNSGCQSRVISARPLSTSSMRSKDSHKIQELDIPDLRRLEASTSKSTSTRWSDAGVNEGESSRPSSSTASSSSSAFFTPFRPSSLPVPPASQVDLQNIRILYPLLNKAPSTRDEESCTEVWRQYHHLAPSTRRSLHPTVMQMILRAVIPNRATRMDLKRKAKDPVRVIDAYSAKMERRLQVIVADMLRSTWVDPVTKKAATIPNQADYKYAMSTLAHLGGTEACEAIYREINEKGQGSAKEGISLSSYRLEALKVWMTGRVKLSNWTRSRPASLVPSNPKTPNRRYRPEHEVKDPATHAISVLWSVLGELARSKSSAASTSLFSELVISLRLLLRFLPEDDKTIGETVRKILRQALEKGFGIDFKFLRQDPAVQVELTSEIVDSVIYLMGSQGDIWRMVAMYESLTGNESITGTAQNINAAMNGEMEEDVGETLSGALEAEEASVQNLDWLGRETISNAPATASPVEGNSERRREAPPHLPEAASSLNGLRRFQDYLPTPAMLATRPVELLSPSPSIGDPATPLISPLATTKTITTMMEAIKGAENIDLAVHLLRTSLRDADQSRQLWLGGLAQQPGSEAVAISAATLEVPEDVADPRLSTRNVENLPPTPGVATIHLLPRRMMVSAQWFDAAHLLARKGTESIWAAAEIRHLMDAQIQSLTEEHLILTGINIEDPISEIDPSALINAINIIRSGQRPFEPAKHLRYLRTTHRELTRIITVSVEQQERRRAATRAKNARRAERDAVVAKAEREKVDAKQALRKRRDEIQEAPLALA